MAELCAVIGRIQLKRIAEWTVARTCNALRIWQVCSDYPVARVPDHVVHAHYKCYVQVVPNNLAAGCTRDRIVETMVSTPIS